MKRNLRRMFAEEVREGHKGESSAVTFGIKRKVNVDDLAEFREITSQHLSVERRVQATHEQTKFRRFLVFGITRNCCWFCRKLGGAELQLQGDLGSLFFELLLSLRFDLVRRSCGSLFHLLITRFVRFRYELHHLWLELRADLLSLDHQLQLLNFQRVLESVLLFL